MKLHLVTDRSSEHVSALQALIRDYRRNRSRRFLEALPQSIKKDIGYPDLNARDRQNSETHFVLARSQD